MDKKSMALKEKKCIPCEGGSLPLNEAYRYDTLRKL